MCVCVCVCVCIIEWCEAPPIGGHQTRRECTCVPACGPSELRGHLGSRGGQGGSGELWGHHAQVQGGGVIMHGGQCCRGEGR